MTIVEEIAFNAFEPWSGAVDTWKRVEDAGKIDMLESILDELYCDRTYVTTTELNDLLWFDSDSVYEWLGMKTDEEIANAKRAIAAKREAIDKMLHTQDVIEFCDLWQDACDQRCIDCPLHPVDCDENSALRTCRANINETMQRMLLKLDAEENDLEEST